MLIAALPLLVGFFATNDNNVEWNGVSHVDFLDRRPICPVDGEAFAVELQAYRTDLTGVRVFYDDGGGGAWVDGYFARDRGPYAVWRADLPATAASTASYYFEVTDGTDVDYYGVNGMLDNAPGAGERFGLDFANLTHAPLGATVLSDGGTAFRVWAPTPNSAVVSGEFNGWATTVANGADGMTRFGEFLVARVGDALDLDQYKYIFRPGPIFKPDARARGLDPSQNYNSVIENPDRYEWVSENFEPAAFEDLVIYQLHVGTFSGRNDAQASGSIPGTYRDVAAHVDHLVELGVNGVWVMPIAEYPTDFSAGYNPTTAWAPEWRLGSPDDLKYMVDVLHQNGIAVFLDIVWNHLGPGDNYLWEYDGGQIYFATPDVQTPWGSQPNFQSGQVRSYFLDSALLWLDEYRMDGFRMDATEYMNIAPQEAAGWSLMQALNDRLNNRCIDKYIFAEQLPDDPWITRPTVLGGAGFDGQLHDYFVDTLRQEIFDAGFGDPEMWKIADIIDGSGQYLEQAYVVNYLGSHDEAWPSSGGQRIVKTIDGNPPHDSIYAKGRLKLGYGVTLYAQGVPMILYGDEWLENTDFTGGDAGGGGRIDWSRKTSQGNTFRWFRDAVKIRRENAALRANAGIQTFHTQEANNVIAWQRFDNNGNLLVVVANFSNTNYPSYQLGFPQPGTWYELMNSQHVKYDGNGMINTQVEANGAPRHGFNQSATIQLPQMGLLVFRHAVAPTVEPCPADLDGDFTVELDDLLILLGSYGVPGGDGDLDGDNDVDLDDLLLMLGNFGELCP